MGVGVGVYKCVCVYVCSSAEIFSRKSAMQAHSRSEVNLGSLSLSYTHTLTFYSISSLFTSILFSFSSLLSLSHKA